MRTNFEYDCTISDKIDQRDVNMKSGDKALGPWRLTYHNKESAVILTTEVKISVLS